MPARRYSTNRSKLLITCARRAIPAAPAQSPATLDGGSLKTWTQTAGADESKSAPAHAGKPREHKKQVLSFDEDSSKNVPPP